MSQFCSKTFHGTCAPITGWSVGPAVLPEGTSITPNRQAAERMDIGHGPDKCVPVDWLVLVAASVW